MTLAWPEPGLALTALRWRRTGSGRDLPILLGAAVVGAGALPTLVPVCAAPSTVEEVCGVPVFWPSLPQTCRSAERVLRLSVVLRWRGADSGEVERCPWLSPPVGRSTTTVVAVGWPPDCRGWQSSELPVDRPRPRWLLCRHG